MILIIITYNFLLKAGYMAISNFKRVEKYIPGPCVQRKANLKLLSLFVHHWVFLSGTTQWISATRETIFNSEVCPVIPENSGCFPFLREELSWSVVKGALVKDKKQIYSCTVIVDHFFSDTILHHLKVSRSVNKLRTRHWLGDCESVAEMWLYSRPRDVHLCRYSMNSKGGPTILVLKAP